jgi:hypothetical protein
VPDADPEHLAAAGRVQDEGPGSEPGAAARALLDRAERQARRMSIAVPVLLVFAALMAVVANGLPGVVFGVLLAPALIALVLGWFVLLARRFLVSARGAVAAGGRSGTVTATPFLGSYGAKNMRLDVAVDGRTRTIRPPWASPRQFACLDAPAWVYGGRARATPSSWSARPVRQER